MAKAQTQKPDTGQKNESSSMRFAKLFFYVAPLVGIALGALYLMQEQNTEKNRDILFSPNEFKSTVVRIIEKSQDETGAVDMKKVDALIEETIKERQPKEKKK